MLNANLPNFQPAITLALLLTYLIGSLPFGYILAKYLLGKDVRASGSGNIGATNVARVVGKKLGALTLFLDLSKGLLPVLTTKALGLDGPWLGAIALAAVLGHCFPVYLRFHGGKGVATGLGVFIALNPIAAAVGGLAYLATFLLSHVSALGSFALLAGVVITSLVLAPPYWPALAQALISLIVLYRHKENIQRLLGGEENRF